MLVVKDLLHLSMVAENRTDVGFFKKRWNDKFECEWIGHPREILMPGQCFWGGENLSNRYTTMHSHLRRPISIAIPIIREYSYVLDDDRNIICETWCMDSSPDSNPDDHWRVWVDAPLMVGTRPDISVSPSIHLIDMWHGFLDRGVLRGGPS